MTPKSLLPDEQARVTSLLFKLQIFTYKLFEPLLPEVKEKKTELTFKPLLWDEDLQPVNDF